MLRMFSAELIEEVSPRSNWIRRTSKLPMFFSLLCTGLIGGVATTFWKMMGELAVEKDLTKDGWFVLILLVIATPAQLLQLFLVNIAMKYYD